MTTPLVTLAEAKDFLEIRAGNTEFDTKLTMLILSSTAELETATGRKFDRVTYSDVFSTRRTSKEVYDLYGSSETGTLLRSSAQSFFLSGLFPDQAQGVEVYYDPQRVFGADTLVDPANYRMDWDNAMLSLMSGTSECRDSLKVVYTAGIVASAGSLSDAAPANLKMACLYQTAFMYKRSRTENVGHTGDVGLATSGGNKMAKQTASHWNTPTGLCREAQGLVRAYKTMNLGRQ